ncbi:hypothetical protein KQI84_14965 [bacterium]|nr:hypothetical protein [bacterium]
MDSSTRQAVPSHWAIVWLTLPIILIALLMLFLRGPTPKHEVRVFGEASRIRGAGHYSTHTEDAFKTFADPSLRRGFVRYFWGLPSDHVAYILPLGVGSSAGSPFLNGDRALEEAEFLLKTKWDFPHAGTGLQYSGIDIHTRDDRRILIVFDKMVSTLFVSADESDPLKYYLQDAGTDAQRLEKFFRGYFVLWEQLSLFDTPPPSMI